MSNHSTSARCLGGVKDVKCPQPGIQKPGNNPSLGLASPDGAPGNDERSETERTRGGNGKIQFESIFPVAPTKLPQDVSGHHRKPQTRNQRRRQHKKTQRTRGFEATNSIAMSLSDTLSRAAGARDAANELIKEFKQAEIEDSVDYESQPRTPKSAASTDDNGARDRWILEHMERLDTRRFSRELNIVGSICLQLFALTFIFVTALKWNNPATVITVIPIMIILLIVGLIWPLIKAYDYNTAVHTGHSALGLTRKLGIAFSRHCPSDNETMRTFIAGGNMRTDVNSRRDAKHQSRPFYVKVYTKRNFIQTWTKEVLACGELVMQANSPGVTFGVPLEDIPKAMANHLRLSSTVGYDRSAIFMCDIVQGSLFVAKQLYYHNMRNIPGDELFH